MTIVVGIDADIIVYQAGFAAKEEPLNYVLHTAKRIIEGVIEDTEADDYILFLTGEGNFRKDVATIQPYKGNRKSPRPEYYDEIRQYMIDHWEAEVVDGIEADDALGLFMTVPNPSNTTRILATIDKDLDMIEGMHYNWRKKEFRNIDIHTANKFFGVQMLTGDGTDNIPGLFKLSGTKASAKLKARVVKAYDEGGWDLMGKTVGNIYTEAMPDCPEELLTDAMDEIGHLLWMQRHDAELFTDYKGVEDG
jgi:hypothetical protein